MKLRTAFVLLLVLLLVEAAIAADYTATIVSPAGVDVASSSDGVAWTFDSCDGVAITDGRAGDAIAMDLGGGVVVIRTDDAFAIVEHDGESAIVEHDGESALAASAGAFIPCLTTARESCKEDGALGLCWFHFTDDGSSVSCTWACKWKGEECPTAPGVIEPDQSGS